MSSLGDGSRSHMSNVATSQSHNSHRAGGSSPFDISPFRQTGGYFSPLNAKGTLDGLAGGGHHFGLTTTAANVDTMQPPPDYWTLPSALGVKIGVLNIDLS